MRSLDVAVIGGGIAGVSAAIYAKRAGLDSLLFEPGLIGGQLWLMECVDNYAGVDTGIKGAMFAQQLNKNLSALDIVPAKEKIISFLDDGKSIILKTDKSEYNSKTVIIATGASPSRAGVKGELEFAGKGVSYCAVCDGFFFKGKAVAVVGGGNTAVEEAIYLSQMANKVYIIHRRDKFRAMDYLTSQLLSNSKIEPIFDTIIKEVVGSETVTGLSVENVKTKDNKDIPVNGLFVAIGIQPNTSFIDSMIKTDERGFIITDNNMVTSNNSIFACGDCRVRPLKQLITAAAEGAQAALSAYKKIKGQYISA
ncbi:MAG: FAD-dependent oxidoreductase [Candidatus Omnitrophica bacterium]|nr:FAD-dependent oxidoreductase [Candidatus Omnitrophota bacterium]MDD5080556.1 FAD-dependent oxidoreductase [Candidatus Omnitrophota bacterium]MDD5441282.1 FAD-dependent oxidoreductase [Candidatus Omnitrophota bacterium]